MRTPKVSVGLPVYNGARYLEEAIDSVLNQEFDDFELILSDNNSTDATWKICNQYALEDPRIIVHRNSANIGAAANFGVVLAAARGEYFTWLGYDDRQHQSFLSRTVEALACASTTVALVAPRVTLIDEDGLPIEIDEAGAPLAVERIHASGSMPHQRLADVLKVIRWSSAQFGLHRTHLLRRTRGMGAYLYSDRVLLAEIALIGQILEVDEPLFMYRRHKNNSTVAHKDSYNRWMNPLAKKAPRRPPLFGEYIRSVLRMPLTPLERAFCLSVIARQWTNQRIS